MTEWRAIGENITAVRFISMSEESCLGNAMATKDHFGTTLDDIKIFYFNIHLSLIGR